jgi:hypothetical protein
MIQKTDLRIGNHLKYFIGEEGIDWDATKINIQDLQWCEEKNENFNEVYKGIELNKTILVMSGFTEDNHNRFTVWKDLQTHYLEFIVMPDGFYPMYTQLPELSLEEEQRVALNRIKYVHELENLFFVLTGKELNVNMKTKTSLNHETPPIGNVLLAAAKGRVLQERQITLSDALLLIDSDECNKFDIHYRYLEGDANYYVKGNIYYSDAIEDKPELTVEKFIEQADNYGSFWLSVWSGEDNEEFKMLQVVDDKTFEPL